MKKLFFITLLLLVSSVPGFSQTTKEKNYVKIRENTARDIASSYPSGYGVSYDDLWVSYRAIYEILSADILVKINFVIDKENYSVIPGMRNDKIFIYIYDDNGWEVTSFQKYWGIMDVLIGRN